MLEPATIISLNNRFWPAEDFMGLTLTVRNNGTSLVCAPAHDQMHNASEKDLIIGQNDSGLPFDAVVMINDLLSLPECATGKNALALPAEVFVWLTSSQSKAYSETSGPGGLQLTGSKSAEWRSAFLQCFATFRLNSWREEFVKAADRLPQSRRLPGLDMAVAAMRRPDSGPLANKTAKMSTENSTGRQSRQNDVKTGLLLLAREMGFCKPDEADAIEKLAEADLITLLIEKIKG